MTLAAVAIHRTDIDMLNAIKTYCCYHAAHIEGYTLKYSMKYSEHDENICIFSLPDEDGRLYEYETLVSPRGGRYQFEYENPNEPFNIFNMYVPQTHQFGDKFEVCGLLLATLPDQTLFSARTYIQEAREGEVFGVFSNEYLLNDGFSGLDYCVNLPKYSDVLRVFYSSPHPRK